MYFDDVSGMTPYVSGERDQSLQNPGNIKYKDMYPPVNRELYYAVTVVDGEGQEEKKVEAKKVFKNMEDPLPALIIVKLKKKQTDNVFKARTLQN